MKFFHRVLVLLFVTAQPGYSQTIFDAKTFFLEVAPLKVTLTSDLKYLVKEKETAAFQKAIFTVTMPDSSVVAAEIKVSARGVSRRKICTVPPLKLSFDNPTSPQLKALKSLKLVKSCRGSSSDEQLLLKEYLIYKMLNVLTENSFRVRLLHITYEDTQGKIKPETSYAFLIEDVDVMAKRNGCKEMREIKINPETTDREQILLVYLFQYMIGNTDWSVLNNHNIKLMMPKEKANARPIAVPYDFDYSGMVNADYAVVDEIMGISDVTQRRYRGFPRPITEVQTVIRLFQQKKESIYALLNNCQPLIAANKKKMIAYLDEFYDIISNERKAKFEFIDNARTQ
jgi:hypothetical protein